MGGTTLVFSHVFDHLLSRRVLRLEEDAARARGEDVNHLVNEAPPALRHRVIYAMRDALDLGPTSLARVHEDACRNVYAVMVRAHGLPDLAGVPEDFPVDAVETFVLRCSTLQLMDVVGTYFLALPDSLAPGFADRVNQILREHKLAYELVGDRVVPKQAEVLHREVVVPALTLLNGRPEFEGVERQYREALDEIASGKWGDAVTDANAAVEQALRVMLGFEGGQLPGLLGEARKRGLLGGTEASRLKRFASGLEALADTRNVGGDAHGGVGDEETAWLAVHWAGALIVFLVQRWETEPAAE